MDFILFPQVGARPLTFGMSPDEVAPILGPPVGVEMNRRGETSESREDVILRYSADELRLTEIALLPTARVFYRGANLFEKEELIPFLAQFDRPMELADLVLFYALGVLVTEIHGRQKLRKSIAVFKADRYEEIRQHMARSRYARTVQA
jgi:hypothetical protein